MLGSCTENINTYVKVKCYLIDVTFAIHLKTTLKVNTLKAKTSRNHCVHFNYNFFFSNVTHAGIRLFLQNG